MKLEDIGFYTLEDDRAKNVSAKSRLWRCELLITNKCNFNCPYCRGTDNSANITLEQAKKTIDVWASNKLKNVRFSGGEPTVVKWLPEIISYSRLKGIERIAISTNGSAKQELYDELLACGVNDISISLDACCASTGDIMAGKKGVWGKVVANIKYLSSKTYVTVGVVLTEENIEDTEKIIEYASNWLGVSDIRIITAAQWDKRINFFNIDSDILERHPILKYRIHNMSVGKPVRGIGKNDNHQCPLVLDDMAVKGDKHYPCIIKLREGCEAIGKIDEQVRLQRDYYYQHHNVFQDKICRENCLDVCVDYNNKVRELNV